jgi:GMP synthase (glutamine-hydrolysing)
VTGPRILVIDGNVAEIRARQAAALGYDSGTGYARVLRHIDPALRIDIVLAADAQPAFPAGVGVADYDGVTMTGSALNVYNGGAPVTRQIELAKRCLRPACRSSAAAGDCRWRLPRQAVRFAPTRAAASLVLHGASSSPRLADAPIVRRQTRDLRGADRASRRDRRRFPQAPSPSPPTTWACRRQPSRMGAAPSGACSITPNTTISTLPPRPNATAPHSCARGCSRDEPALATFAAELRALQATPSQAALLWKHGLGPAMQDEALRLLEISNWLQAQVRPRATRHV